MNGPPPGWYADPTGGPLEFYWDGATWTGHSRPKARPSISTPYGFPPQPPRAVGKPWYQRPTGLIGIVAFGLAAIISIAAALNGGSDNNDSANAAAGTTKPATNSQASNSHKLHPKFGVSHRTPKLHDHSRHSTSTAQTSAPPNPGSGFLFRMPNEVGKDLQDAQDDLQRVAADPLYVSLSHDLSGEGRMQILDHDWQVCTQNVAPGDPVDTSTNIDFGVVKSYETCP